MTSFERAVRLALLAHDGQMRKQDGSAYIVHPIMVSTLVRRYGFSEDVCIAALLHDVIEDGGISIQALREYFGPSVAGVVQAVSEDKTLPWRDRKIAYIKSIAGGSSDVKAVSIADKIHNIESMIDAHLTQGSNLWGIFSAGKDDQIWFFESLLTMFKETWEHELVEEYAMLVARIRMCV